MTWKRLKESEIKGSRGMLPARVALDFDEESGTYWTYLESIATSGEAKLHYGRAFDTEQAAVEDFGKRLGKTRLGNA